MPGFFPKGRNRAFLCPGVRGLSLRRRGATRIKVKELNLLDDFFIWVERQPGLAIRDGARNGIELFSGKFSFDTLSGNGIPVRLGGFVDELLIRGGSKLKNFAVECRVECLDTVTVFRISGENGVVT